MSFRFLRGQNKAPQVEVAGVVYHGACILYGSVTKDWDDTADGVQATAATLTVPGASLGDPAFAAMSVDHALVNIHAYVSAANTVTVILQNESGGSVNLAEATMHVYVLHNLYT